MPDRALSLLAALVLGNGHRWGEVAADFQLEDARAVLDPTSPTPYHFLTRSRGGSKTDDLAGMAVAAMLEQLPPASRLYGLAADKDQGRLLVDSISGFAARTPELQGSLAIDAFKVAAPRTGSVLEVLAADAPGAWGLRPDLLVVDELAQWGSTPAPRRLWEAVTTAIAKVDGARMAVLTTSGDPAHWAHGVLEHALADPLWRVHEVPGPAPWLDPDRLAEQRRRLPESLYRRLFMNEWVAADDRLVDPDALRACVSLEGPLPPEEGKRYVIAADLGLKKDRTVAVICHGERIANDEVTTGLRVVLDRIETWRGTRAQPVELAAVEGWIEQASRAYNGAPVVLDPWQAIGLAQRLRSRGVRVEEFTFSAQSVGRLASTLHMLLQNRLLALPPDEALLDELEHVRLRETSPGVLRMDHDPDRHDDRAIALALAAHRLAEHGSKATGGGVVGTIYHGQSRRKREPTVDEQHAQWLREKELRAGRLARQRERNSKIELGSFDPRYR